MLPLILLIVFLAVFAVIALVMTAAGGRSGSSARVQATLASALKIPRSSAREEIVDVRKSHLLSSVPWVHTLLVEMKGTLELRRILDQADLQWTTGRLLLTATAGWVVSAFAIHLKTGSWATSLLLGSLAGAAPFLYVLKKRAKRFAQFEQRLPDALDLMVSALRAGHSTVAALGVVAKEAQEPIRHEFRLCFEEQNFGVDIREAMANLVERVPVQDLRIISTAILIQKETGGNVAEALDKTAYVIRERFRLMAQIKVHTAQGRLTGLILSLIPAALGMALYVVNPAYIGLLFNRPVGQRMVVIGVVMNLIGLLIIRKVVRIRV
jgi:tight adherence protein B